jgi:hypothetical protein
MNQKSNKKMKGPFDRLFVVLFSILPSGEACNLAECS